MWFPREKKISNTLLFNLYQLEKNWSIVIVYFFKMIESQWSPLLGKNIFTIKYVNKIDCILCNQRWGNSIQSAKTRPGAGYGSDHQLLIAKFRLILKKVGKTTRQLRYDLNRIPYVYTMELTNRFKVLDLVDSGLEELWKVCNILQESVTKNTPKKKKCKKAQWLPEETLQIAEKRSERQRRKGKIYPTECRVSNKSKESYESLLKVNNAKKKREIE